MELLSALEWVGVALISKRASRGMILGVAGSRYTSGPFTPNRRLEKRIVALKKESSPLVRQIRMLTEKIRFDTNCAPYLGCPNPDLKPKTAEDAADEGGAPALVEANSVATRLATSWSSCWGKKIVVSSAPAPSEVPATVDIAR